MVQIKLIPQVLQGNPPILSKDELTGQLFSESTESFAKLNLVKPQSVRKRYAETGSFHGIRPLQLMSRRLAWPKVIATKHGYIAANDGQGVQHGE